MVISLEVIREVKTVARYRFWNTRLKGFIMGGKSRKTGGVSKALIDSIKKDQKEKDRQKDHDNLLKALARYNSDERYTDEESAKTYFTVTRITPKS